MADVDICAGDSTPLRAKSGTLEDPNIVDVDIDMEDFTDLRALSETLKDPNVDVDVATEDITELRVLKRGDHIGTMNKKFSFEYYHHGIFLGHTIGVADFGGTNVKKACTRTVDILQFKGNRRMVRYIYKDKKCLTPEETARKAEKLVANPDEWESYDVLRNNCEHFATFCKIGKPVSQQVIKQLRKYGPAALELTVSSSFGNPSPQASGSIGCPCSQVSNSLQSSTSSTPIGGSSVPSSGSIDRPSLMTSGKSCCPLSSTSSGGPSSLS